MKRSNYTYIGDYLNESMDLNQSFDDTDQDIGQVINETLNQNVRHRITQAVDLSFDETLYRDITQSFYKDTVNYLNQDVGQLINESIIQSDDDTSDDTDYILLKNKLSPIQQIKFKSEIEETIFDIISANSKEASIIYPLTALCEFVEALITNPTKSMYNSSKIPQEEKHEWTQTVGSIEVPKKIVDDFITNYNLICLDDYRMTSDEFHMIVVEQTNNLLDYVFAILARCSLHKFELDHIYDCEIPVKPQFKKYIITLA